MNMDGQGHGQIFQGPGLARLNNISKAKSLVAPIKDSLSNLLKTGANCIYSNNMIDSGSQPVDFDATQFDRSLEDFYALLDQMELHLRTSIECINQGLNCQRYLPTPPQGTEGLTYPQYLDVIKSQIEYAKQVRETLVEASKKDASK